MKNNIPVLIDFDGVLRIGTSPANDVQDFFNFIKENNIPAHIISNSTLKTKYSLIDFFTSNNIECSIPAMTAADAALRYVKDNYSNVSVYAAEDIKTIFNEIISETDPDAVVIGDIGDKWNYDIMNEIFVKVLNGADIIAMQMNKYWKPDGKNLALDAGAFIKAIEFAAGKEAVLIGKPSKLYFQSALKMLNYDVGSEFIMIGDDLETDIYAAQNLGGKGILVYTGKTKYPLDKNLNQKPDFEAHNLKEVIQILKEL